MYFTDIFPDLMDGTFIDVNEAPDVWDSFLLRICRLLTGSTRESCRHSACTVRTVVIGSPSDPRNLELNFKCVELSNATSWSTKWLFQIHFSSKFGYFFGCDEIRLWKSKCNSRRQLKVSEKGFAVIRTKTLTRVGHGSHLVLMRFEDKRQSNQPFVIGESQVSRLFPTTGVCSVSQGPQFRPERESITTGWRSIKKNMQNIGAGHSVVPAHHFGRRAVLEFVKFDFESARTGHSFEAPSCLEQQPIGTLEGLLEI